MLPIYGIALGGVLLGRRMQIQRDTLANLLLYFIAPTVFFFSIVNAPHGWHHLLLIPIFLCTGSLLALIVHLTTRRIYSKQERGILGFIAGSGNTGYFGIPLVAMLLGPDALIVAIMVTIGLDLFQFTIGYYLMAQHSASFKQIVRKILSSPLIWALLLGIVCIMLGWKIPPQLADIASYFNGAYIILGMLVIGLGLSEAGKRKIDMRFVIGAFTAKFILFPCVVTLLILIDMHFLHIFSLMTYKTLFLLSIVPIASDAVAFATILNTHPQKTAHTVMLSSIFSIFYVPILVFIFFR